MVEVFFQITFAYSLRHGELDSESRPRHSNTKLYYKTYEDDESGDKVLRLFVETTLTIKRGNSEGSAVVTVMFEPVGDDKMDLRFDKDEYRLQDEQGQFLDIFRPRSKTE